MEVAVHDGKVYRYLCTFAKIAIISIHRMYPDTESISYNLKKSNTFILISIVINATNKK